MLLIREPQWCLDHPDVLPHVFAEADERERTGNDGDMYVGDTFVASVRLDDYRSVLAEWWWNDDGTVVFNGPWYWREQLGEARRALEMAVDLGPYKDREWMFLWSDVDRALGEAYDRDDARPPSDLEIGW